MLRSTAPSARVAARLVLLTAAVALAGSASGCGGARRRAPNPDVVSHTDRAHAFERQHRYDLAAREYRAAIAAARSRRERRRARREYADALIFWGQLDEARQVLGELVAEDPHAVAAWHDLGILRAKAGDSAGAEAAFRRAIALAPDDPRARIALAAVLVNEHRWDEAEAQYRALLRLHLPERTRRAVVRALELLRQQPRAPASPTRNGPLGPQPPGDAHHQ